MLEHDILSAVLAAALRLMSPESTSHRISEVILRESTPLAS